jgi:hypothetical protein
MEVIGWIGSALMLVGAVVITFGLADQFQRDRNKW